MKSITLITLIALTATSMLPACFSNLSTVENTKRADAQVAYNRRRDNFKEEVRLGLLPSDYKPQVDRALGRMLKDPESRRVEFFPQKEGNAYGGLVCGQVNAKNAYGGYTGFERFVAVFNSSRQILNVEMLGPRDPDRIEMNKETTTKSLAVSC